jgi:hypothetical protein
MIPRPMDESSKKFMMYLKTRKQYIYSIGFNDPSTTNSMVCDWQLGSLLVSPFETFNLKY